MATIEFVNGVATIRVDGRTCNHRFRLPAYYGEDVVIRHEEMGLIQISFAATVIDGVLSKNGALRQTGTGYLFSQDSFVFFVERLPISPETQRVNEELKLQSFGDSFRHSASGAAFPDAKEMDVNIEHFLS